MILLSNMLLRRRVNQNSEYIHVIYIFITSWSVFFLSRDKGFELMGMFRGGVLREWWGVERDCPERLWMLCLDGMGPRAAWFSIRSGGWWMVGIGTWWSLGFLPIQAILRFCDLYSWPWIKLACSFLVLFKAYNRKRTEKNKQYLVIILKTHLLPQAQIFPSNGFACFLLKNLSG